MYKINKLCEGIYHVIFDKQSTMGKCMIRFAEYFESIKYKGQIVCKEQIEKYYKKLGIDFVNYYEGFNLYDNSLNDFIRDAKYLYADEQEFTNSIKNKLQSKCCFIVTLQTDRETILHELSHAFYYLHLGYKKQTLNVIQNEKQNFRIVKKIQNRLVKYMGYGKGTLNDETIAYLVSGENDLIKECHINKSEFEHLITIMGNIFNSYMKKCNIKI